MKNSFRISLAAAIIATGTSLSCKGSDNEPTLKPEEKPKPENPAEVKILYWNLSCGMWADQGNNYDNFVAWVKAQDPDICVWNEAETTFDTGVFDWNTRATEKYLPEHWPEVAARYGHKYVMVNGASQSLVTTSKYPFEREADFYCERGKMEARSGTTIYKFDLNGEEVRFVSLHLHPHHYNPYVPKSEREQSKKESGGDLFRTQEIQSICDVTINKDPKAAENNWIMLGDFNARSPLDNDVYKYPLDSPSLRCISYVLNETPYLDAVKEKHPKEFITSTYDYNHRIDFVFCTPPLMKKVTSANIIKDYYTRMKALDDLYPGQYCRVPSDHYPIILKLDMSK